MTNITKDQAEQAYEQYLKQIESKYGNMETNSDELHKIGKKLFKRKFAGVFASDQIPQMRGGQYAIVNLDDSSQPGSHWVSLVKESDKMYVYDSFGRKTIKILPNLIQSGNGVVMETENDAEQKKVEENCGQRSLASLCVYDNYGYAGLKHI